MLLLLHHLCLCGAVGTEVGDHRAGLGLQLALQPAHQLGQVLLLAGLYRDAVEFGTEHVGLGGESAGALQAMYIGFIWIPAACQILAAVLLYWYRLEEEDLAPRVV